MDDVGIFRTTIEVQNLDMRGSRRALPETLVDTGSEYTEHKHSKSRTDAASSGTSDTPWCAPEEWRRPISSCSRNRET